MKTKVKASRKVVIFFNALLLLVLFIACNDHVDIEEYTSVHGYCDDTHLIGTRVWVREWNGLAVSLEIWEQEVVKFNDIDSVRRIHRIKADSCRAKIERCLKH